MKIFKSLKEAETAAEKMDKEEIKQFCPLARAVCVSGVAAIGEKGEDIICVCWQKYEPYQSKLYKPHEWSIRQACCVF